MANRVVLALGGNALGQTPQEQIELIKGTASAIVDLIENGHEVVVTHGNGPQVGTIKVAFDNSHKAVGNTPHMPFPEVSAMSQGYIGYHLQQALENEMRKRSVDRPCACIITQTLVDKNDSAFDHPTKPVGGFVSEAEARTIMAETDHHFVEDSGRGWRWVVASPKPLEIVEGSLIANLVESQYIVISTGGGGVPVVEEDGNLVGVPAVVDKDRSAGILSDQIHADRLLILTAIDNVAINFNTPQQKNLSEMTVAEARTYIDDGQFAPGSMLPKVEACVDFVDGHPERVAIISSLKDAAASLDGAAGTRIVAS
ncbi:carbamate kinase [Corynebacterium kroppenstedtii]|uniref:carbamate kinase n=1 Tax=Corynebacterium sp. PCR 32 TaxID=3351342 RepID=UPI0030A953EF